MEICKPGKRRRATFPVATGPMIDCILCACCSTSCPSYWWNPDSFLNPAALPHAWRWVIDSRDKYSTERLAQVNDAMKLWRCHGILNCRTACPKNLNPPKRIWQLMQKIKSDYKEEWKEAVVHDKAKKAEKLKRLEAVNHVPS
eukprot:GHVU01124798.1.p1 GENE.GHVU01124798.1~~GHVU01124798.1.p1  ORF type:complete len:143 (-),score=19.79 GHVU01124798.1:693-1121(-)